MGQILKKKTKPDLLLPKVLHLLRKIPNGQKSGAEVVVVVRVLIVMADHVEEKESENEELIGRITDLPIPDLHDPCLDHDLPPRRYLGHILLHHYRIQPLPPVVLEIDDGTVDQDVAAKNSIAAPRHGEAITRKMDLRRINGRFLSLSW